MKNNNLTFPNVFIDELLGGISIPLSRARNQIMGPATNIIENEKEIIMTTIMPGVAKEHINLSFENKILTIAYDEQKQSEIDDESYLRKEFELSCFKRSFTLSDNIDQDSITSKLENGILTVVLPKISKSTLKNKNIVIQ